MLHIVRDNIKVFEEVVDDLTSVKHDDAISHAHLKIIRRLHELQELEYRLSQRELEMR